MFEKIFGSPGYSKDMSLDPVELEIFRTAVQSQWLSTLVAEYPQYVETFDRAGIADYHKNSHLIDHNLLWTKERRLLPQTVVERISSLRFMKILRQEFGSFSISNVVYGDTVDTNHREIYWRIVRPNAPEDVGSIHADRWFHNAVRSSTRLFPQDTETVKIWVPIYCEPGKNGLLVIPDSHLREWNYTYVNKGGRQKPELRESVESMAQLVDTKPGTLLIFNEKLLHGGAINKGSSTRVSVEITLVLSRSS